MKSFPAIGTSKIAKTDTEEFFAPCTDATITPKPFQCQSEPQGLTWRDFR